jgi:hypothetical protein
MTVAGVLLERTSSVIPFGFRAWDPVERRAIRDGLRVTCRWANGRPIPLWPTPSGVFTTGSIAALRDFSQGAGDDAFWEEPPSFAGQGVVEVSDLTGCYLPFRVTVAATHRAGRLAREVCGIPGSPPWDLVPTLGDPPERTIPVVPLFSSPSRPAPSGTAQIIAQLVTVDGRPAAGAVMEVAPPTAPAALGLADRRGMVTVHLPWPPPDGQLQPAPAPAVPLSRQRWDGVVVRVWYGDVMPPEVPPDAGRSGPSALPDLCELLGQTLEQPVRVLGQEPATPLAEQTLRFGQPLILRTQRPDGTSRHELSIDPGAPG